ncbi:hypothetical protein [Amycolatopsis sp. H20-H5]|uniref:hypothetical protein n=1 Tax=Amycolatopsis sp. H20-H5 TaxID=3046309 RepID=UPI002DBCBE3D|nr:hypothetical protein [Amycolatopsis sp. H20-H5]MEC3974542.1 hypothetical protein [Amycolatopsis sp. H20-H5]
MLAMTRYQLALLGHSQRYAPAVVALLAVLAIQYTDRRSPLIPEFAVSAGGLLIVSCWLTVALLDIEDPVQRLVTLSHARGWRSIIGGSVLAVLACATGLTVLSELWALAVHRSASLSTLGIGLVVHLACALMGIAVGLPCSKLLVSRVGWTVVSALFFLGLVLLARWLPLANPMLRAMIDGTAPAGPVLVSCVAAVVLLGASATGVGMLVHRRA